MSNRQIAHLQDGDLLRLLDGELPDRDASKLRSHMEACWTCRTRLEEFEATIGEYVRYREGMKPVLPKPPKEWVDLDPKVETSGTDPQTGSLDPAGKSARATAARRRHPFGLRPVHWLTA